MTVRPYEAKDAKEVKMLIGQGCMEGLAFANKAFIWHPLTVSVWAVAGAILDYYFFQPGEHILSKLKPLIGLAMVALPILGYAEYSHRPIWTQKLREVIGCRDLVEDKFYSGKSKMWVFEHKGEVVGVIAVDAKRAGEDLGSVLEEEVTGEDKRKGKAKGKGVSLKTNAVQIRHIDVDQPIRRHGIGRELLETALEVEDFKKVVVHLPPYYPARPLFASAGFKHLEWSEPVGLLGRRGEWLQLQR